MKCPVCRHSPNFLSQEDLDSHIFRYHKRTTSTKIRYQCKICQRKYMKYASLKMHQETCVLTSSSHRDPESSNLADQGGNQMEESGSDLSSMIQGAMTIDDHQMDEGVSAGADIEDQLPPQVESCKNDEDDLSLEETLQQEALKFLIHLKDGCNASQHIVNEVVKGVDELIKKLLMVIESILTSHVESDVISQHDMVGVFEDIRFFSIFEGVQTKTQQEKYLEEHCGLVKPEKVVFKSQQVLNKRGELVTVDQDTAYIVPFLKQLEKILNCKDVLYCVDNPCENDPFRLKTVLDGYYFRNHPLFKKDPKVLAVILYADGITLTDPLSPRSETHSLTNFYWQLANIYPEYRSLDRTINLLATVKTSLLKKYGYKLILKDAKDGLTQLASEDGVEFIINGEKRTFHGLQLFSTGDNPALNSLGGFKESVSAEKPCRECFASKADYLKITNLNSFQMRSKETHERQVKEVEEYLQLLPSLAKSRENPSVKYGINGRSELMDIPYVDVTKTLVQDLLHIGPEGTEELMCRLIINHVVRTKKQMTLELVNEKVKDLSKYFHCDKPSPIKSDHLDSKLHQSAAQIRHLATLIPFVLQKKNSEGKWTFLGDKRYLDTFLLHQNIMIFCMSYEFHIQDVTALKKLIEEFHVMLLELLDYDLKMAKVHFMHHLPNQITRHGPLRQHACFGYERHHAFFKRIARITRNFENLCYSLALRHQTRQCHFLSQEHFLFEKPVYSEKYILPVNTSDSEINLVKASFTCREQIARTKSLRLKGVTYKKETVVLTSVSSTSVPDFAVVKNIYIIDEKVFVLLCQSYQTKSLDKNVNAYHIAPTSSKFVVNAEKFKFPHEILCLKAEGSTYVIPVGHRRLLR